MLECIYSVRITTYFDILLCWHVAFLILALPAVYLPPGTWRSLSGVSLSLSLSQPSNERRDDSGRWWDGWPTSDWKPRITELQVVSDDASLCLEELERERERDDCYIICSVFAFNFRKVNPLIRYYFHLVLWLECRKTSLENYCHAYWGIKRFTTFFISMFCHLVTHVSILYVNLVNPFLLMKWKQTSQATDPKYWRE